MENGTYKAKPLGAVLGETGTGKEQVGIEFEVVLGEDETGVQVGRITYYGTFTDRAMEITLKALRTSGWKGDDLADLSSVGGPDAPEVSLVIENEEYKGKWSSKVKWVNAPGGLAMKNPITGDKAKAFAAKMRGQVLAHNKAAGVPKPAAPRQPVLPPEPPPNMDEPPF